MLKCYPAATWLLLLSLLFQWAAATTIAQPIKGVNLGGWLVLEPWMNWELVGNTGAPDQWTFDQTDNAESALQSHWGSWFGEADMAKIASWGLNTYV